jgi:cytochrome P450 family 3 subfamily A
LILALTGGFIAFLNLLKTWLKLRNYFKQMNIPGPKPMPIFGNFLGVIRNGMLKYDMELFKTYAGAKTIGYFEFSSPVILTTDPKFLKSVFIKDFSTFVNHRVYLQP